MLISKRSLLRLGGGVSSGSPARHHLKEFFAGSALSLRDRAKAHLCVIVRCSRRTIDKKQRLPLNPVAQPQYEAARVRVSRHDAFQAECQTNAGLAVVGPSATQVDLRMSMQ